MASRTIPYDTIANKLMSKASRTRAKERGSAILKRMALDELRKSRKVTHEKLAPSE